MGVKSKNFAIFTGSRLRLIGVDNEIGWSIKLSEIYLLTFHQLKPWA